MSFPNIMDNNYFLLIVFLVVVGYLIYIFSVQCDNKKGERFWGGWMPVPYVGQNVPEYGRCGIDAATDDPEIIIDPHAQCINPGYCPQCKGYRCCH